MIAKMKKLTFLVYYKEYEQFLEKLRDLGVVHKGTVREQLVSVQNIGTHSFHLKGITTSCDCTKAVCDWKELLPGETGIVTVAYTAEQPGDFFRTVEIFGNIGPESVELSFIGTVK